MKNKITNGTNKVWGIITRNWRHIATFFFFAGFIMDAWLLPEYNDPISRYLGFVYIIISALLLIIKNNAQVLGLPQLLKFNFIFKYQNIFKYILDFALPFFIGSALSFVFIYYYRSVQIAVMWLYSSHLSLARSHT